MRGRLAAARRKISEREKEGGVGMRSRDEEAAFPYRPCRTGGPPRAQVYHSHSVAHPPTSNAFATCRPARPQAYHPPCPLASPRPDSPQPFRTLSFFALYLLLHCLDPSPLCSSPPSSKLPSPDSCHAPLRPTQRARKHMVGPRFRRHARPHPIQFARPPLLSPGPLLACPGPATAPAAPLRVAGR